MEKNKLIKSFLLAAAAGGIALSAHAQVTFANFENFADGAGPVLFQNPGFSGSNRGVTATSSTVVTNTFPAGVGLGDHVLTAGVTFDLTHAGPWLRLTTHNAPAIPLNVPTISLQDPLSFDFYTTEPVYLALGIRTTGTTADFGEPGGAAGAIHWVGLGPQDPGTGEPPRGNLVPAGVWVNLVFDIPTLIAAGNHRPFAGVGGSLTDDRGVLEHLAISPAGGAQVTFYMDNFTVIPEPSTYAAIFGGLALLGAFAYRRRLRK